MEANQIKEEVTKINETLKEMECEEEEINLKIKDIMMKIPNIIDSSVPIGEDDSKNVELEKFGNLSD